MARPSRAVLEKCFVETILSGFGNCSTLILKCIQLVLSAQEQRKMMLRFLTDKLRYGLNLSNNAVNCRSRMRQWLMADLQIEVVCMVCHAAADDHLCSAKQEMPQ